MSELNISVVIMRENILISGEIYTTGKYFTLPPAVTAVTNSTSDLSLNFQIVCSNWKILRLAKLFTQSAFVVVVT